MKKLLPALLLFIAANSIAQSEIMDSIESVRTGKMPLLAKSLCTKDYWVSEYDGGTEVFEQICKWPPEIELKLNKEQKNENRAVLTVDFYHNNILRDRVYIFLEKQSASWLIDGFNETEQLIKHYLDGYYTGHFNPTDLPGDKDLENFGGELVSFGQDETALKNFVEQNAADGSESGFISQMASKNYEPHLLKSSGYDSRLNKGFIYFKGKAKDAFIDSNITLYVSKNENGAIKILYQNYTQPWASGFF